MSLNVSLMLVAAGAAVLLMYIKINELVITRNITLNSDTVLLECTTIPVNVSLVILLATFAIMSLLVGMVMIMYDSLNIGQGQV